MYKRQLPGQVDRLGLSGRELSGAHLGLVGAGAIGQAVARRALALGMKVSAVDPFADPTVLQELGITPVATLDELLPQVNAISLHVPGVPVRGPLISAHELDPVSYTHLDVYKRQGLELATRRVIRKEEPPVVANACPAWTVAAVKSGITPVSYTHLDVYKRQTHECRVLPEDEVAHCAPREV